MTPNLDARQAQDEVESALRDLRELGSNDRMKAWVDALIVAYQIYLSSTSIEKMPVARHRMSVLVAMRDALGDKALGTGFIFD